MVLVWLEKSNFDIQVLHTSVIYQSKAKDEKNLIIVDYFLFIIVVVF